MVGCAHSVEPSAIVQIPVAAKLKLEQLPDRPTFPELKKISEKTKPAAIIKAYVFAFNQSMSYAHQQEEILNSLVVPRR